MQEILSSVFQSPPIKAAKTPDNKSCTESDNSFHTLLHQKTSQNVQSQHSETTDRQASQSEMNQPSTEDETPILLEQQILAAALTAQVVPVFSEECSVLTNAASTPVGQPAPVSAASLGASINPAVPSQATAADHKTSSPIPTQTTAPASSASSPASSPAPTSFPTDAAGKVDTIKTLGSRPTAEPLPLIDVEETVSTAEAPPLFSSEEAIPIKVGEPLALDTQSADMDSQLTKEIIRVADQGSTQLKVNLSPENLGTITIEVSRSQDGTLRVALSAMNERAQALLDHHSASLQSLLSINTRGPVQVEVTRQQINQSSQQEQPFYDQGGQGDGRQQQNHRQQGSQQQQEQDFFQRLRLGLTDMDTEAS